MVVPLPWTEASRLGFEPGITLGPYVVRQFIDAGGMGEVYVAFDPRLERQVAIKVLPASLAEDAEFRRRFKRETQAISRLNHKNICTVFDTGTYEDRPYIVMELMDGATLESLLHSEPMDVDRLLHIGIQVASALDAAHQEGIVHRDIKTGNIFVNTRGDAKVLDFGIAKLVETGLGPDSETGTRITMDHSPIGTVAYMSPEQARGEEVDARTDIFSLGVVLHEMATGRTPFRGSPTSVLAQLVSPDPIPPPRALNPSISPTLERVICRALEKDKGVRYQTAADLLAALRGLRRDLFVTAAPGAAAGAMAPGGRGSGRLPLMGGRQIGALVVISVAALALVYSFLPGSGRALDSVAILPCGAEESTDGDEYLCDRLAKRLIETLSEVPELTVPSYPVVEPYAGGEGSVREVGQELQMDAVVTLRVRQEDDQVHVEVFVTNVRTGGNIFSDTFLGSTTGSQRYLEDIAQQVAEAIHLRLSDAERARWALQRTFQEAQYQWSLRNAQSLATAVDLYNQVIEADANHARAYAGLANAYILLHYYASWSPQESYPRAKAAADAALRLDGTLAEAHVARAMVFRDYERDFVSAENEFQRAISLDDRSALALQWYAELLTMMRRYSEAEEYIGRAEDVAPTEVAVRAVHGWILLCAGDLAGAGLELRRALTAESENILANWFLGQLFFAREDYFLAAEALEKAVEISGNATRMRADRASALAMAGIPDEAGRILETLEAEVSDGRSVSNYELAIVHAGLGENDEAFLHLLAALDEGTWQVANMAVDPMLGPLHDDPRFPDLLLRAGLGVVENRDG